MSLLEIRHLNKNYGDKVILNDVSLKIEKGDIYGILGLSGAGKSTLVRCINSLENFSGGEIYYENELLCSKTQEISKEKRKKIGMIFQSFNLLEQSTVLENVKLGLKFNHVKRKEREKIALEALKKVGLEKEKDKYPSQLSGGQCQRVAIARVLALKPSILLSDEATSALDPETTSSILSLLKTLNKDYGLTIIMISHQMNVIEKICNKVAILDNAKIVEEGNISDVFLNPKTTIAKKLIYSNEMHSSFNKNKLLRITFDGNVDEPIISSIVLDCKLLVSIEYASTKVVDGKVFGQTIIEVLGDDIDFEKLKKYLSFKKINFEEVNNGY